MSGDYLADLNKEQRRAWREASGREHTLATRLGRVVDVAATVKKMWGRRAG
jgi:hypothetical protein